MDNQNTISNEFPTLNPRVLARLREAYQQVQLAQSQWGQLYAIACEGIGVDPADTGLTLNLVDGTFARKPGPGVPSNPTS